jgi:galactokinase
VTLADLEKEKPAMPDTVYRRCRHVVTEDQRVLDAATALQTQDVDRFGQLMYQSHASLRDDYEVSCAELDLLVDLASSMRGVYGARMMGGGFGGCTVNLVHFDWVAAFQTEMRKLYVEKTGTVPDLYICEPAQGAEAWPV